MMSRIPKNINHYSQFTRKFNRFWTRLFSVYGLQLQHVEENICPKWKKYFIVSLPRIFSVLCIIRYFILTARMTQYEVFVIVGPPTILHVISIYTAFVLQKREQKFSALYKILLHLTLNSRDATNRIGRNIYTTLFIIAALNAAIYISIIMMAVQSGTFLEYAFLVHNEFNFYLLQVFILVEAIFNTVFVHFFLGITVLYFSYMCKVLELAFKTLNEDMKWVIISTSGLTNTKLNVFRRRYQYLSHIAEKISKIFSPLLLLFLMGFVFIFCLKIRSVKPEYAMIFRYYFIIDACHLIYLVIVIFKNSSELHAQTQKMKGKISELLIISDDEAAASTKQDRISINCLLFSQTLNADNVGISVSGLFLLSTFSFLNMASTVMTYVVLVYQS
uniref:Gustatory receptor n=1 Tax=Strigamia maritima TaxID=126957 RepID=T1JP41_STRMM